MTAASPYLLNKDQERILHGLLDRLERATTDRLISITVTAERFPRYFDDSNPAEIRAWGEDVRGLEARGWVALDPGKGPESHRIARIRLNRDRANEIETTLGRISAQKYRQEFKHALTGYMEAKRMQQLPEWWKRFLLDQASSEDPAPQAVSRRDCLAEFHLFLSALEALAERSTDWNSPLTWRQFAVSRFSDSKCLDPIKGKIVKTLHQYALVESDTAENGQRAPTDDSAVLSHFGIELKEDIFLFHGPALLRSADGTWSLDSRLWYPFVSVPERMLTAKGVLWDLSRVSKVVTIENEEPFHGWARNPRAPDWLAIYLGGFPSRQKVRILQEIARSGIPLAHWGDMDCGGFEIYLFLEKKLQRQIQPVGMDTHWLRMHSENGRSLTQFERKRLLGMLDRLPDSHPIQSMIATMLDLGIKLEQEAIADPVRNHPI